MAQDLSDAELDELDALLADAPEPLDPLDLVMVDGYLAGVIVQPKLIPMTDWLPPVFDMAGQPLPADTDAAWLARCTALVERRYLALNRAMAEDRAFDPILSDAPEPDAEAGAEAAEAWAQIPEHSRPVFSWVAGFQYAVAVFPDLATMDDDDVLGELARVFRHLPGETEEEKAVLAELNAELPLASSDEAIEDLVIAVCELWELTSEERFRVEPVRRETPKVGRNDPCPCGSGKKFKQCHGG